VKVLVVDDDVDARDLMHELFTSAGAHVTLASGGVEALTTLRAIAPDVIVSDIGMPEMDGFELIKRIRQWPEPDIAGMPAIALSAYLRQQDESAAAGSGFNAFQPKPLNVVALLETIMTLTKRRVGTR
jgi:CheY-like chemotaxis protein